MDPSFHIQYDDYDNRTRDFKLYTPICPEINVSLLSSTDAQLERKTLGEENSNEKIFTNEPVFIVPLLESNTERTHCMYIKAYTCCFN